jgi:hypothetical protein
LRLDENLLRFYLLRLLKRNYFASGAFILTSVVSVAFILTSGAFILTSGAFILTSGASVAFILTSIVSVACAYFDVYCVFCCVDFDVYCVLTTRLLAAMTQKRSNIYWSNIYWTSFASSIDANLV